VMVPTDATSIAIWIPVQLIKLSSSPAPNCSNRTTGHLPLLPLHTRATQSEISVAGAAGTGLMQPLPMLVLTGSSTAR
jgi:hypothetical protein